MSYHIHANVSSANFRSQTFPPQSAFTWTSAAFGSFLPLDLSLTVGMEKSGVSMTGDEASEAQDCC